MTLRFSTGTTPRSALPQPAGGHLRLHHIPIFCPCLTATPLSSLPAQLTVAACPLARAATTALVRGTQLPIGAVLLKLDWQAPTRLAWIRRVGVSTQGLLHGSGEAQLWSAAALSAAPAGAVPAVCLGVLLCLKVRPAGHTRPQMLAHGVHLCHQLLKCHAVGAGHGEGTVVCPWGLS